jgi:aspartate/methionine/tyrosine aminotransferase
MLAERIGRLGLEGAFEVLQKARALEAQGRDIVHLEIGEPDFDTPRHVIEEGKRALDGGFTHYGPTMGLPELREAIARHVASTRGIEVAASQVCVTPGAKPALFYAMMAVVEKGDEVIFPDPGFPIYASLCRFLEAKPVPIPLEERRGFSFDLDRFASALSPRTKLVILNSPQNPTGGVMPAADVRALAALLRERNVWVVSDEIYGGIFFDAQAPRSIASEPGLAEKTMIVDGFSKSHAMTGWRLGYGVYPDALTDAVMKLMVNTNSCTASFVQRAGVAALEGPQDECRAMVEEFRARRDLFCAALNAIPGFRCPVPAGAFYAFPNVAGVGLPARELASRLLDEAGVACLAGTAFGEWGEGYLRFSMANSRENLAEAARRIAAWVTERS